MKEATLISFVFLSIVLFIILFYIQNKEMEKINSEIKDERDGVKATLLKLKQI